MNDSDVIMERCKSDPVFHIKEIQGVNSLESHQINIAKAIVKFDRIAVKACHNIGKTFLIAKLVLWFGSSFPRCKIITTAPTNRQVKDLLWSEIRSGHRKSANPLGGEMLTTTWKLADDWFVVGFTARVGAGEEDNRANFQGYHAPHIFLVFDEATGIPIQIWNQAEGMTTGANIKFIAIGNPTSKQSKFFDLFSSPSWHKITINCFDSPNLKVNNLNCLEDIVKELTVLGELPDEDRLLKLANYKSISENLLTARWVLELAMEVGIDHPIFRSKALGEFPDDDEFSVVSLSAVEASQAREGEKKGFSHFGVDVARFGSDKTVITEILGDHALSPIKLIHKDNVEVVGYVIKAINACKKPKTVSIDATGLGSGVVDGLKEARDLNAFSQDVKIREIHFGSGCKKDKDKKRFFNYKAKIFSDLGDEIKDSLILPGDSCYQLQLPSIKITLDGKGRLVVESKKDYKRRTGKQSPDEADSLALAIDGKRRYSEENNFANFELLSLTKPSTWSI